MFFANALVILWLSQPLVYANMLPVAFGRGGKPIDFGLVAPDGRPLLGPGKTWPGLFGGLFFAVMLTFGLVVVAIAFERHELYDLWGLSFTAFIVHATTLAAGALLGDLLKSYLKRRRGLERGQAWPIIDQFDAVIGGFALTAMVDWPWFREAFITRWSAVLFMFLVYYVVHRCVSFIGYRLGLKSAPH